MYARTQNLRNGRGHGVALALVRAVCSGVAQAARVRLQEAGLDPYSVGGGWFADYLVTDENPCDMTEAEMAACWPFDEPAPVVWSENRWRHNMNSTWMTGDFSKPYEVQDWADDEGLGGLDAPPMVAAGSCVLLAVVASGFRYSCSSVVVRGAA